MGSIKNAELTVKRDGLFTNDDYGKPISEQLSEIIRRNVSKNDYANIAMHSNVSFSTIRDVVYRTNSLTKSNAKAISLLIQKAYENSNALKHRAEADHLFLGSLLKV